MTDQQAVELLKQGNRDALGWIFTTYRNSFTWWAMKKYSCSSDDAIELFEDTLIELVKNVQKGSLVTLTATIKTYLIAIAINKKKEEGRKNLREISALEEYLNELETDENPFLYDDAQEVIHLVVELLRRMGQPCNEILTRFYFDSQSLEFIKGAMGMASTAVVKVQKGRCLRDLLAQILKIRPAIHESLGNPCSTLLKQYFIEKQTLEHIKTSLKFTDVNELNAQKDKCLKDLLDKLK